MMYDVPLFISFSLLPILFIPFLFFYYFLFVRPYTTIIHPSIHQPFKRPLSSMSPSLVLDSHGRLKLIGGASGGSHIITATAQVQ
jgi:gamma-glutamyltranspeptidase